MPSKRGSSSRSSDITWLGALFMTPVLIGSFAAFLLMANLSPYGRPSPRRRGVATDDRSLAGLRDAILGSAKQQIASVFGPPYSAAARGGVGDTWYYPLRASERLAMAISFDHGTARDVEFFHAPT
jgi:hypothetical protein